MTRPSRDWKAIESTNFGGGDRKLTVTGEVETHAGNEVPKLTRAVPQGINPRILILDLGIDVPGVGTAVMGCKPVEYSEGISHHQFDQVTIRGESEASIDVEEVIS